MNIQKPTLVHVIAWTTLASGIVNIFWGFAAAGAAISSFIGIFCAPFAFLPSILGVFELIYAAKLFSDPPQIVKPSTNIAVFEIASVLTLNVFSMAVGILSLVFYNDTVVKEYFNRLGWTLQPAPVTPTPTASLPEPELVPAMQAPPQPEFETPAQPEEETPAKPKRTPRKIAKK